jgi:hypothetical protein
VALLGAVQAAFVLMMKDLPPGEQLVTLFRPFLEHLAGSNLSPKTTQKHVGNVWALGGEFIRVLTTTFSEKAARGPSPFQDDRIRRTLLYHGGEDQQDRLIPPAESFGGSSSRRPADACCHPQIPPTIGTGLDSASATSNNRDQLVVPLRKV